MGRFGIDGVSDVGPAAVSGRSGTLTRTVVLGKKWEMTKEGKVLVLILVI